LTAGLSGTVLDSSALLAYLREEPGAEHVEDALIPGAMINSVNYAEVLTRLAEVGDEPVAADRRLRDRGLIGGILTVVSLNEFDSLIIAQLRALTRAHGLSLGDRACLATGLRFDMPVLTADRAWAAVDIGVPIRLIRP
jgi:ribonuclease VapC